MPWSQPALSANPTGGTTAAGNITITPNGRTLTIQQQGQRAIINWQDFSIGAGELTRFIQPDATSAVLNRVVSGNPSTILGHLEANGRIFLLNPNGILVGAGALIDTAAFLASTLNVRDDDFLRGGDLLFRGDSTAAVQNLGTVNALGGDVFLIARKVENHGTLAAANGTAGLAAGSEVLLTTGGSERVFIQGASAPGALLNAGQVSAASAELKAAGGNAYALAINNSGVVRATGTAVRAGQVWLVAPGGTVESSGTLDVSSAARQGGDIRVAGERVSLAAGSRLDASGATDGGRILVLGDAQVTVGGTLAAGASSGGNGGFIETSAARVQVTDAARVTTAAPQGRSGTWLIDPVDFTVAASGGDMTGAAVGTALAGGNFTIQSSTGAAGTAGAVNVNDPISWGANKLTLNAQKNINLNASLTGSGTASLALEYGQGAVAAGNTGSYVVNAAVTLPAGNNFSTKLGSDGVVKNFTVITSLGAAGSTTGTDLQGMNGNLAGNYALGDDVDASATSTWNAGAGFAPIGGNYTGSFDGLGHAITGLFINRPATSGVGLFGTIYYGPPSGSVSNVRLVNVNITGGTNTGALAGILYGSVTNSSSTGTVTGGTANNIGGLIGWASTSPSGSITTIANSSSAAAVSGGTFVAGLVGQTVTDTLGTLTISNSHSTGNVTATGDQIGGLAGQIKFSSSVVNSYSTGNVIGANKAGGLVGVNSGGASISGSYSTGNVTITGTSPGAVGGLVGYNKDTSSISTSYSTGDVSGGSGSVFIGGLIGYNTSSGAISDSHSDSRTTGTGTASYIGGFIGDNEVSAAVSITNCYSTGTVTGPNKTGGFIGYNNTTSGTISNCYSTSAVNAADGAGFIYSNDAGFVTQCFSTGTVTGNSSNYGTTGFMAQNSGTVTNSYSTSAVPGANSSGFISQNNGTVINCYSVGAVPGANSRGFIWTNNGTVTNGFWDTQTSGQPAGTGEGGTGLTTAQMKSLANFTSATTANGNVNPNWDFATVWRIYDGYTYPLLKTFLSPLTVTATAASKTYNGTANSGGNGVTYSTPPTAALLGTLGYGGNSQGARNVGTYTLAPAGLYSNQLGYDITTVASTLTINQAALTIAAAPTTKSYDGTAASATAPTVTGLGSGDTLPGLTQVFSSPNAGARTLSVGGYTVNDGNGGNNYTVTTQTAAGTITPATLAYAANAASRTYGAANPAFTGTVTGFVNGETQAGVTTGTLAFSTPATSASNTGTYAITGSGLTLSNGNYTLAQAAGNATALTINPATLTYTANAVSRPVGSANPAFSGTVTGFVNSETAASATTGILGFSTAATAASPVGGYALTGAGLTALNGNYVFVQAPGNATAFIIGSQVPLTITADNKTKLYGAALPAFTTSYAGFVNGDTAASVTGLQFSTTAAMGSNVGTYTITPFGATAPAAYAIGYVPGTLTINPAALTIAANSTSRTYGGVNPAFTAGYLGLVNGDTAGVVTGLTLRTTATTSSPTGSYPIIAAGATAPNYAITFVDGVLGVGQNLLTITADNQSNTYGAALPAFTASYAGFVNGDAPSVVTGLQFTTAATAGSPAGAYAITPFGATAANYTLAFLPGTLTVTAPFVIVNGTPVLVMMVAHRPMLTGTFAAAEFAGRRVLVPAGGVRLGESLDARLAGTLGRSNHLTESGAEWTSPAGSPRPVSVDWREELVALRKLARRTLVLSSSYDTLPSGEGRVGGFFLSGFPQ